MSEHNPKYTIAYARALVYKFDLGIGERGEAILAEICDEAYSEGFHKAMSEVKGLCLKLYEIEQKVPDLATLIDRHNKTPIKSRCECHERDSTYVCDYCKAREK